MIPFNIELLFGFVDTCGTLMIAFAALKVHHRVLHDHKIDAAVFKNMRFEQRVGVCGAFMVLLSFLLELLFTL